MADISIDPTAVRRVGLGVIVRGTIGEIVTAGMAGHLDVTDQSYKRSSASADAAAVRKVSGVFLNGGAAGQPCAVLTEGEIEIGATLVVGAVYALSASAGRICPVADLAGATSVCVLGTAISASRLRLEVVSMTVAGDPLPPVVSTRRPSGLLLTITRAA